MNRKRNEEGDPIAFLFHFATGQVKPIKIVVVIVSSQLDVATSADEIGHWGEPNEVSRDPDYSIG